MIKVIRLNSRELVINADLIESIESTPDVVISLTTGNKIVVRNSISEIIDKVMEYKVKAGFDLFNLIQGKSIKRVMQENNEGVNDKNLRGNRGAD